MTGVPAPLSVNPAPFSVICDTVTLALPELVTVTLCVDELPVFTFPKATLVVLKESVCVAATPVPVRAMSAGEFGALLTIVILPPVVNAEVGANSTLKLADCPALICKGMERVPILKLPPVTLTCVTVRLPVPLFIN